MIRHLFVCTALTAAGLVMVPTPVGAQTLPPGYRVSTWGYYDRFPYPSPIASSMVYTNGPPIVSYVDPWGRVVDMPLRPKVLYGNTPFMRPGGSYYPISIVAIPDPGRSRPTLNSGQPPIVSRRIETAKPSAEAVPPIPKARDFDAPATPKLPPIPKVPATSDLPPIPMLPASPKPPPVPGVPNLGPAPAELPAPARKPG